MTCGMKCNGVAEGGVGAARLSFLRKKTEKVEAEFFFVATQEIFSFHSRMEGISALVFFVLGQ